LDKKSIIAICLVAVGGAIALVFAINAANNANRAVEQAFSPSFDEIRQMCYDTIKQQGITEPTEMVVNMCAGIVTNNLNK
jgi:hypothetical protein